MPVSLHGATTKVVGSTGAPSAEPGGTRSWRPQVPFRTCQAWRTHSHHKGPATHLGQPRVHPHCAPAPVGCVEVSRELSAAHVVPHIRSRARRRTEDHVPCRLAPIGRPLGSFGCRSLSGSSIYPNPYSSQCSRYSSYTGLSAREHRMKPCPRSRGDDPVPAPGVEPPLPAPGVGAVASGATSRRAAERSDAATARLRTGSTLLSRLHSSRGGTEPSPLSGRPSRAPGASTPAQPAQRRPRSEDSGPVSVQPYA